LIESGGPRTRRVPTHDSGEPQRWHDARGLVYHFTGSFGSRGLLTVSDPSADAGHAIQVRNRLAVNSASACRRPCPSSRPAPAMTASPAAVPSTFLAASVYHFRAICNAPRKL